MNKEEKGFYFKVNYSIEGEKLAAMEKVCTLNPDVLRTMVIKRDA